MKRPKFPFVLGVIGVLIGFTFMAMFWYDLRYNPFHMPSGNETGNYSAPLLYTLLDRLMHVLVPGVWLIVIDGWVAWVLWVGAVLANGPIYYGVGQLLVVLLRGVRGRHVVQTKRT